LFQIIFAHIFSWNNAFLRILSKRRTGRGRSISEAMTPYHGEEEVVESAEGGRQVRDAGGLCGLLKGRVYTGNASSFQQEVLEGGGGEAGPCEEWPPPAEESGSEEQYPSSSRRGGPAGRQMVKDLLNLQRLGPLDWAGEAKPSLREGPVKLKEGQAIGPDKIPQDSAKGVCLSCWRGEDLGKIPSLGVEEM
jgi:hypothetical protein